MKSLSLIFACWLLFLSVMPCGDRQECSMTGNTAIVSQNDHQDHRHATEHCTPFCTCACCAATCIYQPNSGSATAKTAFFQQQYNDYNAPFCSEVAYAIWQPPRLS